MMRKAAWTLTAFLSVLEVAECFTRNGRKRIFVAPILPPLPDPSHLKESHSSFSSSTSRETNIFLEPNTSPISDGAISHSNFDQNELQCVLSTFDREKSLGQELLDSPVSQKEIVVRALANLKKNAEQYAYSATPTSATEASSAVGDSDKSSPSGLHRGAIIHGAAASYSLVRNLNEPYISWRPNTFEQWSSTSTVKTSIQAAGSAGVNDHQMESYLLGFDSESTVNKLGHKGLLSGAPTNRALVTKLSTDRFQEEQGLALTLQYETVWRKCLHARRVEEALEGQNQKVGFDKYNLHKKFGVGGQGEVWEAEMFGNSKENQDKNREEEPNESHNQDNNKYEGQHHAGARPKKETFVLKRVFVERGEKYRLAGLRESTFGARFQGNVEIARFVESFEHTVSTPIKERPEQPPKSDVWLVFHHEGSSLDSLLYSRIESGHSLLLEPSELWHRMRRDYDGALVRREILRQILEGLAVVGANGVAHRDVKPSNILISEITQNEYDQHDQYKRRRRRRSKHSRNGSSSWAARKAGFQVKISDFGSAIDTSDPALTAALYGDDGPTAAEETRLYRPPEAFIGGVARTRWPYLADDGGLGLAEANNQLPLHAFDMWSVGVVALEMLLGTSHVFELSPRERARLDARLRRTAYLHSDVEAVRELQFAMKALEAFGITPPAPTPETSTADSQFKSSSSDEPFRDSDAKENVGFEANVERRGAHIVRGGNRTLFNQTVTARDPLQRGFYFYGAEPGSYHDEQEMSLLGDEELDFVWTLLSWSPFHRPTAEQLLEHPYFAI